MQPSSIFRPSRQIFVVFCREKSCHFIVTMMGEVFHS